MHIKPFVTVILFSTLIFSFFGCAQPKRVDITPKPTFISPRMGSFEINKKTLIAYHKSDTAQKEVISWFQAFIKNGSSLELQTTEVDDLQSSSNTIVVQQNPVYSEKMGEEGYRLQVKSGVITINANTSKGVFYAFQSLRQMMPVEIEVAGKMTEITIQGVDIQDRPTYSWRGMHLDVSRHFFSTEFVKEYIDLLAFHKMNVFHWHLTDDNGWRIEIKKYPKLQEVAAWRVDREHEEWRNVRPPKPGEKATYGGYYTQEEIKEIVAYAAQRQIMVVPEIEMPGHSCEVLAAYPGLGCAGNGYYVQPGGYWPNEDILCAGDEKVFEFLEDVIDEVVELFPSPYIHVGGDEATKTAWEFCPKCRMRMQHEGLDNVDELQSYFIRRIEKYVISKGKKLIGWDEILEGGLAAEATVMSWRGLEGGIAAARSGHDAIMCPVSHCYFDYYQADPEFQPVAIGGLTTLKKVYSFNPTPSALNEEEAKHILGGQGNIWTEWIATPEHVEYMAVPRMTALAEKLWTKDSRCEWTDFRRRMKDIFVRFDAMDVNYCEGSFRVDVETTYDSVQQGFWVSLSTEAFADHIYYTINNNEPDSTSTEYLEPFFTKNSMKVKAISYKDGTPREKANSIQIAIHKAMGKDGILRFAPEEKYACSGSQTLLNGLYGSSSHTDGQWLGFKGKNMELVIDMGESISVNRIQLNALAMPGRWIFLPRNITVSVSDDGKAYEQAGNIGHNIDEQTCDNQIVPFAIEMTNISGRFIKIVAQNYGALPTWHKGSGDPAWLFVDEVVVE